MTASSGRTSIPTWIPETPDNELEVGRTMRAYEDALALIREREGIPGLMAELTRINGALQEQASRSLTTPLISDLRDTLTSLDQLTLRSRPTGAPSSSPKGRAAAAFQPSPPPSPSELLSGSQRLGRVLASRIVASHIRRQQAQRKEGRS